MKSLKNNNSGKILIDSCRKINVNDIIKEAKIQIKPALLSSLIESKGYTLELTTTKLFRGGDRYWFKCPLCKERVGILYHHALHHELIGCRKCLSLEYRSRRFKGMVENSL